MRTLELYNGNCLTELQKIADNTIDSVVTDPPYELGFMGKSWDASGIAFNVEVWRECLRVLKPGGHILAFGGTRTYHRMTVAIEDAGFEIRDCMAWMYGSGFPKSHNIGKAVDKIQGNEREVVGVNGTMNNHRGNGEHMMISSSGVKARPREENILTKGQSEWEGWGTALKPAFEPIVMGRKPFKGTVAQNVLEWGVGGLNIDGCRVGNEGGTKMDGQSDKVTKTNPNLKPTSSLNRTGHGIVELNEGRWPANVMLDEEAGKILDKQSGITKSGDIKPHKNAGSWKQSSKEITSSFTGDKGGASRFFYSPKANKNDKGDGNIHPTVKPTTLMEYLIKLVTPKGGKVLDPFMGSGSTGKGAVLNDYSFVGIELSPEYFAIAESRINAVKDKTKFWC